MPIADSAELSGSTVVLRLDAHGVCVSRHVHPFWWVSNGEGTTSQQIEEIGYLAGTGRVDVQLGLKLAMECWDHGCA